MAVFPLQVSKYCRITIKQANNMCGCIAKGHRLMPEEVWEEMRCLTFKPVCGRDFHKSCQQIIGFEIVWLYLLSTTLTPLEEIYSTCIKSKYVACIHKSWGD